MGATQKEMRRHKTASTQHLQGGRPASAHADPRAKLQVPARRSRSSRLPPSRPHSAFGRCTPTPYSADRIPRTKPAARRPLLTKEDQLRLCHLNHPQTRTYSNYAKKNTYSEGEGANADKLMSRSNGRSMGFHFTTDFVRRIASRTNKDKDFLSRDSTAIPRSKVPPSAGAEEREQQLCRCIKEADKAIVEGNPCQAIMWFEAAVAAIDKCDARLIQQLGAAHKLMHKMSKALAKGRTVHLTAQLTDDIKVEKESAKGVDTLSKELDNRLQETLKDLRKMLYSIVFDESQTCFETQKAQFLRKSMTLQKDSNSQISTRPLDDTSRRSSSSTSLSVSEL